MILEKRKIEREKEKERGYLLKLRAELLRRVKLLMRTQDYKDFY